ncbi:MAG: RdgB/HAM1 family non-canonical purine NTP pyrophosphatase [Bdellovibrionota bacterium]
MTLVIASNNTHKIDEIQAMLDAADLNITCLSLRDIGFDTEMIEDALSFAGNALKKAKTVAAHTAHWVLADDSGLCVDELAGKPGIYSARYAGENATDAQNNQKLLSSLAHFPAKAYYHCSIVLMRHLDRAFTTEGQIHGQIIATAQGTGGFGYDPIFYLPEQKCTMAELGPAEKNTISHRHLALHAMLAHIKQVQMN